MTQGQKDVRLSLILQTHFWTDQILDPYSGWLIKAAKLELALESR